MRKNYPSELVDYLSPARRDLFWSIGERDETTGCLIWGRSCTPQGYGRFSISHKGASSTLYTHRIAYALVYGPFDDSLVVRHTCNRPSCYAPEHLILGTMGDNARDRAEAVGHIVSDADAIAIYRDTRTHREIAAAFGVSKSYVAAVRTGRLRWYVTGAPPRRTKPLR